MPAAASLKQNPRQEWLRALPMLASIALVWVLEQLGQSSSLSFPQARYLVAHSVFEVLAMVLAALSFALLWMAPLSARRTGVVTMAAMLAGSAVLDFLHMLSYEGMPPLVTASSVEKGIAFWLAGRAMTTLGLLAVAFMPTERTMSGQRRLLVLTAALVAAGAMTWLVLFQPQLLPRTFVAGQGLTGAKVAAELVLIVLLLLAAARLQLRAWASGDTATAALAVAATLSAAGEACFASYSNASDLFNVLGHVAKIGAYWYLTRWAYLLAVGQPLATVGGIADALQATLDPALICSESGQIRWFNQAFARATGQDRDSLVGQDIGVLEVVGDEAAWREMRAAMAQGREWKGQVQARRRDGSLYTDERSLTPMRGPQGHLNGFVMLGDDITERERIARELRTNAERLRALLEAAPDAIVVIDTTGRVQMANPAVERLLGYRREELAGADVGLLMPSDHAVMHGKYLQRYLHTHVPHVIGTGREVVAKHKDGRDVHVHMTVGEAQLPDGPVFIGFMRDISERIRAEAALAEREERYRALMDTAMDGVLIIDTQGRVLAVNDAYCRRSGYGRAELLLMRVADLEAHVNAVEVGETLAGIVARGHGRFETSHRDKAGRVWPVEVKASFWPVGNGQLFVFLRDLTDERATALALRQSEERFELALRGANDGLWDRDLVQDTLYLSPRWKEMLGYRDEELPNSRDTFAALLHPADALAVRLTIEDIASGRGAERFELEMRMRHKDGHWVPVLSRGQLQRDASGRPLRLTGTHQDLSERHRAEAALRESEDKLRNLFELSPLGIALGRLDGRLVEFNEAYRQLTGYSAEALRGLSFWDLTPPEYMRVEAEQLEILTRTGRYGPYDKEYLRADGSRVPVRLNGVRIVISGQSHLWSIVEDLSATRQIESERQSLQRQQLQSQKLEALGHLTGGIAHDFNNMLAGIMGLASLGLERYISEPDGKLAQYLREIVRTSERGRDLVAKMLAYVRTEESDNVAPRELAPMLAEMCDMLKSSIPSSIVLSCEGRSELPPVRISAVDMHQIIMNLVLNARDAVGAHGHIDVRLDRTQLDGASCSECGTRLSGDFVVLDVADDGSGIPPDVLPKIFDPFFTTKEVGKGTGLGLSSVIGLVHKAGGHIEVSARQPQGTLMRVWLPVASGAAVQPVKRAKAASPRAGAPLWVVDDDPAVLVFLTELLREHGFQVAAFADPHQALQALREAQASGASEPRPAVLITDQTMPKLSGTDLARAAMAQQPGLPVILCTGYSEQIDAESACAMGIRHFLRKPFDSRDLLAALSELLGAQSA